jgi:hypothetical protein
MINDDTWTLSAYMQRDHAGLGIVGHKCMSIWTDIYELT